MSEYSTRMNGLSGSATREILKLTALPEMISFAGGTSRDPMSARKRNT